MSYDTQLNSVLNNLRKQLAFQLNKKLIVLYKQKKNSRKRRAHLRHSNIIDSIAT